MDYMNYPECLEEIIKYMDFLPEDDELRKGFLKGYILKIITA